MRLAFNPNFGPLSSRQQADGYSMEFFIKVRYKKGRILNEFTKTSGLHRKASIRLLDRCKPVLGKRRSGRPRLYGFIVVEALKAVWEASDRLCSKPLHPFLLEYISVMRWCGEIKMATETESQLCHISAATIDRLLRPWKQKGGRRLFSTTKPGNLIRNSIPIRTFADWQENRPGFIEVDLVAQCGESLDGFHLNTLMAVDVATSWSEFIGLWGKVQQRVGTAIHNVRERLPFRLLGLDSDNGSEFINHDLPDGVSMKALPSHDRVLTRRMITVLWNKRMGL